MNAYVTAPITENIWLLLGPEFGADTGNKAVIVGALYGLKSSGREFRNHLEDCMRHMAYKSCIIDPDLCLNPEIRTSDGFDY